MKTNGGNGGYHRKSTVSKGTPRTPKEGKHTGLNTARKRAQDGTRANGAKRK